MCNQHATAKMFRKLGENQLVVRGQLYGATPQLSEKMSCFLWLYSYIENTARHVICSGKIHIASRRQTFIGSSDILTILLLSEREFESYLTECKSQNLTHFFCSDWPLPVIVFDEPVGETLMAIARPFSHSLVSFSFGAINELLADDDYNWPELNLDWEREAIACLKARLWGFVTKRILASTAH